METKYLKTYYGEVNIEVRKETKFKNIIFSYLDKFIALLHSAIFVVACYLHKVNISRPPTSPKINLTDTLVYWPDFGRFSTALAEATGSLRGWLVSEDILSAMIVEVSCV